MLPSSSLSAQVQVINNIARAILGVCRADRVPVRQLLDEAGLRSLNETAFMSSAVLAWLSMSCETHPLHHDFTTRILASQTRASAAGKLRPLPPREAVIAVAVANAINVWNAHHDLRSMLTVSAAKNWARKESRSLPI